LDLNIPEFLAGLKALDLISKLITCPLWSILEDKNISMFDMNMNITYLQDATSNTYDFMTGQLLFSEHHVKKDCIYDYLPKSSSYDEACHGFLKVILSALCKLCKKNYIKNIFKVVHFSGR
jgi:hypothetical protein